MKLRSKLILINCVIEAAASIVCSLLIMVPIYKSYIQEAESSGLQSALLSFMAIEDATADISEKLSDNIMKYLLKEQADDFIVCIKYNGYAEDDVPETSQVIFNHTIFTAKDLQAVKYSATSGSIQNRDIEMAELRWEHKRFYVYVMPVEREYYIYKLVDVTYVQSRLQVLVFCMALVTVSITGIFALLIFMLLKRVLQPLQELNEGTKSIASGNYGQRIQIVRNDEIGELSENFNKMAGAVEYRANRLKESERQKTLFIGDLTHELKTPLTAISGYSRTLLSAKLTDADKEEALSYIYGESLRLERLSKKMMNLLLLDEEEHIEFEEVSVKELFDAAAAACQGLLSDKKISLECHENGEQFFVDADLMTDVLINLIDNAVKASSRGGRIVLSAEKGRIVVRDFGIGIPEEEKDKILEPFYMIDKSRSRKSGGAGLGLAITAVILKKHNCELAIESQVGKGTTMILQFV